MHKDYKNLIAQTEEFNKQYPSKEFPQDDIEEFGYQCRKIGTIVSQRPAAAAYGESQVGKSYLLSSLLSSPGKQFEITSGGTKYNFLYQLNTSGGNYSKEESTGIVTRFTINKDNLNERGLVRLKMMSIAEIIMMVADSYYNDVKIADDSMIDSSVINSELNGKIENWHQQTSKQSYITKDDIRSVREYFRDFLGAKVHEITKSDFFKITLDNIEKIQPSEWADVFSLLWNKNKYYTDLFRKLIQGFEKIKFAVCVYVPVEALLRNKGSLLMVQWLDTIYGAELKNQKDTYTKYTRVYDETGKVINNEFGKGILSALTAEVCLNIPDEVAEDRTFLNHLDLLDFPGARSRKQEYEKNLNDETINETMPLLLRRGKVACLFNNYNRLQQVSSLLFCHHNDQNEVTDVGNTIANWVDKIIGCNPEERATYLKSTEVSPLFFIATKFNIDLKESPNDKNENSLIDHWKRFGIYDELVGNHPWYKEFTAGTPFRNMFPLRDFEYSKDTSLYSYENDKESGWNIDKQDYYKRLKESFTSFGETKKHFSDPNKAWDDVTTPGHDGSKAIIDALSNIAPTLYEARRKKCQKELSNIASRINKILQSIYIPDNDEARNSIIRNVCLDIQNTLILKLGQNPQLFGTIIDHLMIPVEDIRRRTYEVVVCHTRQPIDFTAAEFARKQYGIELERGKQAALNVLCEKFGIERSNNDNEDILSINERLKRYGSKLTFDDLLLPTDDLQCSLGGVVASCIVQDFFEFLNKQIDFLETLLPNNAEVFIQYTKQLLTILKIPQLLRDRINIYIDNFDTNSQPNVISDYVALTLCEFVSSFGYSFLSSDDIATIKDKAEKCNLKIDFEYIENKDDGTIPLTEAFDALNQAKNINTATTEVLDKLPFWKNMSKWKNMLQIGILHASNVNNVDPVKNQKAKDILDVSKELAERR